MSDKQYPRTNLIGHTSQETAFVIDDYPYGRYDRCKKLIWIEKATRGAKRGMYRPVYVTTNPKKNGRFNKPHAGQYSILVAYYINEAEGQKSDGYVMTDSVHSPDEQPIRDWAARNAHLMDNSPETREDVVRWLLLAQRLHINFALYDGRRNKKEFVDIPFNGAVYRWPTKELAEGEQYNPPMIGKQGPKLWEEFNTPWMLKKEEKEEKPETASKLFGDW